MATYLVSMDLSSSLVWFAMFYFFGGGGLVLSREDCG